MRKSDLRGIRIRRSSGRSRLRRPTSDGSRSGVNWIRLNDMSMELARLRASCVLPVPGLSSSRMWPPTIMAVAHCRIGCSLPTTTWETLSTQLGEQFMEFGDVGLRRGHHGRGHGRLRGLDAWCRSLRELARCHYREPIAIVDSGCCVGVDCVGCACMAAPLEP